MNKAKSYLTLNITLNHTQPSIWREIQIPARYSFWDLHVAIQDCMGWLDYHLFQFTIRQKKTNERLHIGIPDDSGFDMIEVMPAWESLLADYLTTPGDSIHYEYDFGDGWEHTITFTGIGQRVVGEKYPQCIDGERACPPEDCGGIPGYQRLLEILFDPKHDEYEQFNQWIPEGWQAEAFNKSEVKFRNPKKRLNEVMEPHAG